MEVLLKAALLLTIIVYTGAAVFNLDQHEYAIDITYQPMTPSEDPVLHFEIRTYVQGSEAYELEYNVSGVFNREPYSNGGSGSSSSSRFRHQSEHIWYHDFQEEEIQPGDTILYTLRLKAAGLWFQSITHTAIVGQEAPTSYRIWQQTSTTTTTTSSPQTTRPTPSVTTAPAPTAAPRTTTTQPPTTRAPGAGQPQSTTTVSPNKKYNERWSSSDFLDCLRAHPSNYTGCASQTSTTGRSSVTTPVHPATKQPVNTTPKATTARPSGPNHVATEPAVPQIEDGRSGGDQSGQEGGWAQMDITILIVAIVVPVVVMVGLIVIVTIVVKHRRGRAEPDPYQQVFNNMNYNSDMEIAARPGLPPPRGQLKKPMEETEYAYAESRPNPDGDIYEAITQVDYELNGRLVKPTPLSHNSSQRSTTTTAKAATEWGSDEYEDPTSPQRLNLKSRKGSQSSNNKPISTISPVSPNPTYSMYQDPARNPRATLATSTVSNTVYGDAYQDPVIRHGATLPANMSAVPNHVYSDTYQDPALQAPVPPPAATDPPQQLYEIPGDENDPSSPTRQYSALRRDESGVTVY